MEKVDHMTVEELKAGEELHINMESLRALLFEHGLTGDSKAMIERVNENPDYYLDLLAQGSDVVSHYENIAYLLSCSIFRLYRVLCEENADRANSLRNLSDELNQSITQHEKSQRREYD